jgi:hypothetical protein
MKRIVLFNYLFLFALTAVAQNKGQLSGKLTDSSNNQPLALATVTVFKAADTSIITYRLSNPEGEFKIPAIAHGVNCRVVISYSGYRTFRKEFQLNAAQPNLNLGTIRMVQNEGLLEEVVVLAETPPVVVRNDTIEFNAASFKTLPTALVEDLLRKLPGVLVDGDGKVTVNGREVNRILVDGKAFFGDDPKMATRNLPANLIDKVEVTDDKEEIRRSIDGDLSDIGKVINLRLKKGVKKGWFGKVYGGAGTKDRYEAGGIGNIFRDTLQLSILAFSNNINRSGFSMKDVQELGGFNRSGTNSMMMSDGGGNTGFAINNISFGGLENGINRTTGAGFNLNHAPNANQNFFVQYFYGHGKTDLREQSNSQQFIADTVLNTANTSNTFKINATHSASAGMKLKIDSLTDLNMRASFSSTSTDNNISSRIITHNDKLGPLSTGGGNRFNDGTNSNYNHNVTFNRSSARKKGRRLDVNHSFNYNKNAQHLVTEQTNFFRLPTLDTVLFEQMRAEDVPNINASVNANVTEPLTKKLSVRLGQHVEYLKDEQRINTFGRNEGSGKYQELNEQLSNGFSRQQVRSNSTMAFTYNFDDLSITAGVNALWQDIDNRFIKIVQPADMRFFNIMPSFRIGWKKISLSYSEDVRAPGISYLNPVPDNTNPFFIRESNPDLKPTKRRQINGSYYNVIANSNISVNGFLYGHFSDNDIIHVRTIDERGVQVTKPVNVDGTRSVNAGGFFSKQFKNDTKFIFSINSFLWAGFGEQPLIVNNIRGKMKSLTLAPSAGVGFNWNDVVEFRPNYRLYISQTRYTDKTFSNLYAPIHNFESELIVRWPGKLVWETNVNHRRNPEVAAGMPKTNTLWNAGLTYSFLKEDKGQVRFSVYDILNRNTDFYRSATENYIFDHRSNILQRYFMLTFNYNIRTMGAKKKIGGRERLFGF